MIDYRKMYLKQFNAVSDAIEVLNNLVQQLVNIQQETEKMYIDAEEADIRLLHKDEEV